MDEIFNCDCIEGMRELPADSVDAIVTDPPYGLNFMGKDWDHGVPGEQFWSEALRVAKPGAYLLAFGGTRTHHRLACAIEDSGWEIRDCLGWLYGSGVPKSQNVSKQIEKQAGVRGDDGHAFNVAGDYNNRDLKPPNRNYATTPLTIAAAKKWQGWGTALKPAWEPIVMGRKPLDGTVAHNVMTYGTGAINIDACRVPTDDKLGGGDEKESSCGKFTNDGWKSPWMGQKDMREAVSKRTIEKVKLAETLGRFPANIIHDGSDEATEPMGNASRFFYCAKASKKDRGEGNNHPTVKPQALMQYLIKLVTPEGAVVLDPFLGSGSTAVAAVATGRHYLGYEILPEYFDIACARLDAAKKEDTL